MAKGENKVFGIMDGTGEIKRLIEAKTERDVRAYLLRDTTINRPSTLTVARLRDAGVKLEQAE
jgi:hypothetical protein